MEDQTFQLLLGQVPQLVLSQCRHYGDELTVRSRLSMPFKVGKISYLPFQVELDPALLGGPQHG